MTHQCRTTTPLAIYVAALIALGYSPRPAHADLVVDIDVTLALVSGTDTLGLDGATVSFDATFPTGTVYVNGGVSPSGITTTDSLTISGASNATANGTFSDPDEFAFDPAFGFFTDASMIYYRTGIIDAGLSFRFGLDLMASATQPNVGDYINPSDFTSTIDAVDIAAVIAEHDSPGFAAYSIAGGLSASYTGSTDPASVPEPSSFLYLGLIACGGMALRRKRAARTGNGVE